MDELLSRFEAPLGDRYRLLRQLGRGGMADVYLAKDLRLKREVAVKIMRPDVIASVGPDRFLREIDVTAHLSHPNIVQVYDSGSVDEFLYYVMPYIEGESLRQRLEREGQLPVDEALRITREVAMALEYAHQAGVVHRDVKPGNIMLHGDRVLVTDFGIARALAAESGERLTGTGLAIGSAHYMSPEQATASSKLDARSDQYSLACVLFEMLAGEPPFSGHTVHAIIARQAVESAPVLRLLRDTIPLGVEAAVGRALSKVPADRFVNVQEFVEAFDTVPVEPSEEEASQLRVKPWAVSLTVVVTLAAAYGLSQFSGQRGILEPLASATVGIPQPLLVAPPVIAGSRPTVLSPDDLTRLLNQAVSGEGGMQVISADSARLWWASVEADSESSPSVFLSGAADLGAVAILRTTILETETGWRVMAVVQETSGGEERFREENLQSSGKSEPDLIEKLAKRLLIHDAGEDRHLNDLLDRDITVLKTYLGGLSSYRTGRYREAVDRLGRAVSADTTFALAAIELAVAARLLGGESGYFIGDSALSRAWAQRSGLAPADSAFLAALAGTRYPNHTSAREYVANWEQVVGQVPARWEASFQLGTELFENGRLLDLDVPVRRAAAAFAQLLETHPRFAPALEYAIQVAALEQDTVEVANLVMTYLGHGIERDRSEFVRWLAATFDPQTQTQYLESLLRDMDDENLKRIMGHSQLTGSSVEWAEFAAALIEERTVGQTEHWLANFTGRSLALNLGRPRQATANAASLPDETIPADALILVVEAMYWDGDSVLARLAVQELPRVPTTPPPIAAVAAQMGSIDDLLPDLANTCTLGLWSLHEEDSVRARELAGRLELSSVWNQEERSTFVLTCRRLLDAKVAAIVGDPDAGQKADELERLLLQGYMGNPWVPLAAQLGLARLREEAGDVSGALAVVRRRRLSNSVWSLAGLSSLLREEGRLAEEVGDREGAIRAYRHFLLLRYRPEPELEPEVEAIRERLTRLEQGLDSG